MLAYAYPPVLSSGTTRSVAFSTNLPDFGWEPTILTVDRCRDSSVATGEALPAGTRIIRARELNLDGLVAHLHGITRKVMALAGINIRRNYYHELLCLPDAQIAWLSWWKGLPLARRSDVIYVSCSPFSSALAGCLLKRMTGTPLVVDFRDPWSLNPYAHPIRIRRKAISMLEQSVLRTCDKLILNTPGAEALYKRRYPQWRDKIVAIPNGYDSLNLADSPRDPQVFVIMHVGSFYGSRSPDMFLDVLTELGDASIQFVQVGPSSAALEKYKGNVRVISTMPHRDALALMRTASLLYLKQGFEQGVTDYVSVAAKAYEYLATGLPILADCPEGDNAELIRQYSPYPYVVTSGSRDELKAAILRARAESVHTVPRVSTSFKETFYRPRLTAKLARVLDAAAQH